MTNTRNIYSKCWYLSLGGVILFDFCPFPSAFLFSVSSLRTQTRSVNKEKVVLGFILLDGKFLKDILATVSVYSFE